MDTGFPPVEIANDRHSSGGGSVYRESISFHTLDGGGMGTHFLVEATMISALEEGDIVVGEDGMGFGFVHFMQNTNLPLLLPFYASDDSLSSDSEGTIPCILHQSHSPHPFENSIFWMP